jgi:hypothetical protein
MMMQASYVGSGPPGVFNVPVTEPMNGFCNTPGADNTVIMAPQAQPHCAPQQFAQDFPQTGAFMWVPAAQPMTFWPNSYSCEGMQASEVMGKDQPVRKQHQRAATELTSNTRRKHMQREMKRSQREGNGSSDVTLHAQDLHREGKHTSSSGSEDGSSTRCSSSKLVWADALQDEFPSDQVPLSWGEFRDECASESSQQDPCLADAVEAEFPSDSPQRRTISRKIGAAAANGFQPLSNQACDELHDNTSLQETSHGDDAVCPEAALDPVLLALENVDGQAFRATLDEVVSSAWWLSWTKRGSRLVQKAIEVGTDEDQKQILGQLHGRVLEALKSPHANHVLQKCIEIMSPDQLQFAMAEIQHDLSFAARHRFGCRILQRLIEHGNPCQTEGLISELVSDAARLCRHQFGNFAIQHILQHGAAAHRSAIAKMLCADTIRLAKHRIASYVISCALSHCAAEDVVMLTQVVLQDAGQLADLSRRQYGSFVVREVHRAARLHEE